MAIKCPGGKEELPSRWTAVRRGVFTEPTMRRAAADAQAAVLADLVRRIGQAECEGGTKCTKKEVDRSQMLVARGVPSRLWWTLFIVVECRATASQRVTIECVIASEAELGLPN